MDISERLGHKYSELKWGGGKNNNKTEARRGRSRCWERRRKTRGPTTTSSRRWSDGHADTRTHGRTGLEVSIHPLSCFFGWWVCFSLSLSHSLSVKLRPVPLRLLFLLVSASDGLETTSAVLGRILIALQLHEGKWLVSMR